MSYQFLTYKKKDGVALIEIVGQIGDLPKVAQLSNELTELCTEIGLDETIRVILLTNAEDNSFTINVSYKNEEGEKDFWSIAEPIAKLEQPVIAAINGNAIGEGLELVLACDIRIASERSYFGLPHIKVGLIPWDGGAQRLARLVGKGKALEMILTGEMIDAQEAFRIGLVNKVVSKKELMKAAMDMLREMSTKGPISLRYAKEAIYKGMDMTLEQGLRLEADLYFLIHTTKDRTEGIQAFQEKRVPKFEGK